MTAIHSSRCHLRDPTTECEKFCFGFSGVLNLRETQNILLTPVADDAADRCTLNLIILRTGPPGTCYLNRWRFSPLGGHSSSAHGLKQSVVIFNYFRHRFEVVQTSKKHLLLQKWMIKIDSKHNIVSRNLHHLVYRTVK